MILSYEVGVVAVGVLRTVMVKLIKCPPVRLGGGTRARRRSRGVGYDPVVYVRGLGF